MRRFYDGQIDQLSKEQKNEEQYQRDLRAQLEKKLKSIDAEDKFTDVKKYKTRNFIAG
jgi:plasmid maintenance system killer protein